MTMTEAEMFADLETINPTYRKPPEVALKPMRREWVAMGGCQYCNCKGFNIEPGLLSDPCRECAGTGKVWRER